MFPVPTSSAEHPDYFEKFYGPAAKPMADYFMAMEQSMQDWNGCASYGLQGVRGLRVVGPKVFTPQVMQQMRASLEEAERMTAEDEVLSERVAMARKMYTETHAALGKIQGE